MRITAPLNLVRILHRLWSEGRLLDVSYLEDAFLLDEQALVRGYSTVTREMEWRSVYWDEAWDADFAR